MPEQLDYFVPFLLYRVIARGVKQATTDYAKLDLSIQEARALIVLARHRTMRVSALADITCIEASALSHMLRGLSRRGLLMRSRVKQDNRAVDVTLTASGSRLAHTCVALSRKHEETLLKRFSAKDRAALRAMLRRMYENAAAWSDGDRLNLHPAKGNATTIIARAGRASPRTRWRSQPDQRAGLTRPKTSLK